MSAEQATMFNTVRYVNIIVKHIDLWLSIVTTVLIACLLKVQFVKGLDEPLTMNKLYIMATLLLLVV